MKESKELLKITKEIESEFPEVSLTFKKKRVRCDNCNKIRSPYVWLSIKHKEGGVMGWGRFCSKKCLENNLPELKNWLEKIK
jgi:hypothetical protein